ncbi:DUF4126 family protein [Streptomyces coelicoflavus]|uniref:DUF4126 family protein n=1 Tax=Streptomyces coelicoflavus TaxID=285562 RepID=UPI0036A52838
MNPKAEVLVRVGLIGAVSGLRSQWGMAAVSWTAGPSTAPSAVRALLSRPWVRGGTLAAAAGEFVADKSPYIPSRLTAAGLGPRLVLGAAAGAALSQSRRGGVSEAAAAAVGASAALASALAGARWRRAAGAFSRTDAVAAIAEDIVAAVLAWAACTSHITRPPQTGGGVSSLLP